MAAEVENDANPYKWEEGTPPTPEVLQLWTEVGNGLDKNQTGAYLDDPFQCGGRRESVSVSHSFVVLFVRSGYVGFLWGF